MKNVSKAGVWAGALILSIAAFSAVPALAQQKTAKACAAEWKANKAANEAKGITEKAYVEKCKAEGTAEKPKAAPAEKATKMEAPSKMAAPAAGGKKTAKECEAEWKADKAANEAKHITEKAYVKECEAGAAAMKPAEKPVETKMAPPKAEPAQTKMAPPAMAPATGQPAGANQYTAEAQAKAHCPSGTVVWANLESKIFHFAGHADYGHTKKGAYMCEADATKQGMRAAKNEK